MKKDKTQLLKENEALFQETLNEFSYKSYELASVNEIIKRSKFNKGSFYYRFKDKFELYIALIDYIYVIQIDLFKQKGIRLNDFYKIDKTIKFMFENLIDLYQFDKRYYKVIKNLNSDNIDFINKVNSSSTQSLYERFLVKLRSNKQFTLELEEITKSLYINFPIDKIISKKIDLDHFLNLFQTNNSNNNKNNNIVSNYNQDLTNDLIDNSYKKVNYFIGDFFNKNINLKGFNLFKDISKVNKYKNILKFKSFNPFLSIKNLLNKYKKKPIFNYLAVENLLDNDNYSEINNDELLRNITFLLVYAIIDLNEYIILNNFVKHLSIKQLDLLFNKIIPILGKLSKIIIMDNYLYYLDNSLFAYYILDSFDNIKKLHTNFNDYKTTKFYNIYYKKNNIYYNDYFEKYDEITNLLSNENIYIVSIKTMDKISYIDLIESR